MRDLQPGESLNFERERGDAVRREHLGYSKSRKNHYIGTDVVRSPLHAGTARPEWMDNPGLLPKRPPGAR